MEDIVLRVLKHIRTQEPGAEKSTTTGVRSSREQISSSDDPVSPDNDSVSMGWKGLSGRLLNRLAQADSAEPELLMPTPSPNNSPRKRN